MDVLWHCRGRQRTQSHTRLGRRHLDVLITARLSATPSPTAIHYPRERLRLRNDLSRNRSPRSDIHHLRDTTLDGTCGRVYLVLCQSVCFGAIDQGSALLYHASAMRYRMLLVYQYSINSSHLVRPSTGVAPELG